MAAENASGVIGENNKPVCFEWHAVAFDGGLAATAAVLRVNNEYNNWSLFF